MPYNQYRETNATVFCFSTQFILIKMFNLNSYAELGLDDVNVYDFEFPLTAEEYENAVNEQIAQSGAYYENQIADYYTY